ncbi:DUF4244 domain-containing protein [Cellulomonas sp.]|uniref:DUF4244 domain-containing protein n=1 Tax=Cellulomonas sp. TaxID=40001 RepID=UPI001B274F21|nr:DUF4244 domain-containing protein [Cellulomonas sp.]MBO9555463.1 DUF4244 domain-containing protein [Cellulomonas sp.]
MTLPTADPALDHTAHNTAHDTAHDPAHDPAADPTLTPGGSPDRGPTCIACTRTPTRRSRWRAVRPSASRVVRVARHVRAAGVDAGMATAEYAIATLAAVGFAGLLVVILKGNEVKSMLMALVRQALTS